MSSYPSTPFARRVPRLDHPQRIERVLHHLDGVERAVPPAELAAAGERLWRLCRDRVLGDHSPDYILGLDAGGILPALAVSLASGVPYRLAWKVQLPLHPQVAFIEAHALRQRVYVYGLTAGERTLIVDDEVTTGQTLCSLAGELRSVGVEPLGAACLVENCTGRGRARLEAAGLRLACLETLA